MIAEKPLDKIHNRKFSYRQFPVCDMTFDKHNIFYLIAFMLIGAILGSALGTLVAGLVPSLAVMQKSLTGPIGFSLEVISINVTLNLSSIIGLVIGLLVFRKV